MFASRTLTFRAPTRIDFGGGWTDVPPYCDREGGYVCNLAISRYASVRITGTNRPDAAPAIVTERPADSALVEAALRRSGVATREIEVMLRNDFPVGAGLGGSSAAGVATVAALSAWRGDGQSPGDLAERSRDIELEDLGIAGGRQDYYAAAFGGALGLAFSDRVHVRRIALSDAIRSELERRCILIYTGQSRISGDTITAVLDAYRAKNNRVIFALARMKELARQMASVLHADGGVDALAGMVGEHWAHQRALHPAITTPRIDAIVERAHAAGARGAKALGASGGGCVLVITDGSDDGRVRSAIASLGEELTFTIDEQGVAACP